MAIVPLIRFVSAREKQMAKRGIPAGAPDFDLKTSVGGRLTKTTGILGATEPTSGKQLACIAVGICLLIAAVATLT